MSGFLVNKSLLDPTVTQYSGGTASFTLPQSGSTNATQVIVGGVEQIPGVDFNVSGTALTLTTSAPAGSNMVCARQYFADGITGTPADNSVDGAKTKDALIADYSDVTITAADLIMYGDATDSNNTKRDTVQGILDLGGGSWNLIGTAVASSSASLTVTGLDSTYDMYCIGISQCVQATDAAVAWLRVGDSGGVDSGGSDYGWSTNGTSITDTTAYVDGNEDSSDSEIEMSTSDMGHVGNAAGEGFGATLWLNRPADGTTRVGIIGTFQHQDVSSNSVGGTVHGQRHAVITLDRILFQFSTGNIATGRMTVWGIAHA